MATPRAELKLALGAMVVTCVTGYMAFLGGSAGWQYYLTVDECLHDCASLSGKRVRVNGTVDPGSLSISQGRTFARFALRGSERTLQVACTGPLPDNLAGGIQVVVEGKVHPDGWLEGDQVLTRCASKYQAQSTRAVSDSASAGERLSP